MKVALQLVKLIILFYVIVYAAILNGYNFKFVILRTGVVILFMIEAITLLRLLFKSPKITNSIKNGLLSVFAVILLLAVIEIVFMFIPRSAADMRGYAGQIWKNYYWHPINAYGFRDRQIQDSDRNVIFIGDSFTAGHGLKRVEQRFSDMVGAQMADYNVINLGLPATGTAGEYEALVEFMESAEVMPEKIVLQYCGNDIDDSANEFGLSYTNPEPFSWLSQMFKDGSYLVNYLASLYRVVNPEYLQYCKAAYSNDKVFNHHAQQLDQFVAFAEENNIELVVVVIPFLQAIEESKAIYTDRVIGYLETKQVQVIDVGQLCADLEPAERLVNSTDGHASEKVNELIADKLVQLLRD